MDVDIRLLGRDDLAVLENVDPDVFDQRGDLHLATMSPMNYLIKAHIPDTGAKTFRFPRQKTMYGGRRIAVGDTVYLFDSETEGGTGLIARGIVTAASAVPRKPGVERQTPRVDVDVKRTATACRKLGRDELRTFRNWNDGRPETELNFKFYRQATNKIGGITDAAAKYLQGFFSSRTRASPARSRATRRAKSRSR